MLILSRSLLRPQERQKTNCQPETSWTFCLHLSILFFHLGSVFTGCLAANSNLTDSSEKLQNTGAGTSQPGKFSLMFGI